MPVGLNAFGLPRTSQLNPMLPALLLDKGRRPQQFTNGRNCRHWFWPRPISLAFPDGDSVFQERSPGPTCRSLVHLRVRSSLTRSFICSSHAHSGASSCLQSSDYSSHSFIHSPPQRCADHCGIEMLQTTRLASESSEIGARGTRAINPRTQRSKKE